MRGQSSQKQLGSPRGVKGGFIGTEGASKFKIGETPWKQHIDQFSGSLSELTKDRRKKQRKLKQRKLSSIHSLASQYRSMAEAEQVGEVTRIMKAEESFLQRADKSDDQEEQRPRPLSFLLFS